MSLSPVPNVAAEPTGVSESAARLIVAGSVLTSSGIALSIFDNPTLSAPLTLLGFCLGLWGLHRLGRSGPDPELAFPEGEPQRDVPKSS